MKQLLYILFLLPLQLSAQVATITLADGTFINNAPSGRSWVEYKTVPGGLSFYPEKDTTIIDDSDQNRITYYGNWRVSTGGIFIPESSSCNCSWSRSSNDSLVFKFTNVTRFEWYGEKMSHHGMVELYWQDQYIMTIDTYGPDNINMYRHWFIDNLDTAKIYKFKLVATGGRNIASTGAAIVNHGFLVINTVSEVNIPPEPGSPIDIVDTIRLLDLEYSIIREGRFQIYIGDSLDIGQHNEYEKAIEHALRSKALNPTKDVTIKSPIRRIELE